MGAKVPMLRNAHKNENYAQDNWLTGFANSTLTSLSPLFEFNQTRNESNLHRSPAVGRQYFSVTESVGPPTAGSAREGFSPTLRRGRDLKCREYKRQITWMVRNCQDYHQLQMTSCSSSH